MTKNAGVLAKGRGFLPPLLITVLYIWGAYSSVFIQGLWERQPPKPPACTFKAQEIGRGFAFLPYWPEHPEILLPVWRPVVLREQALTLPACQDNGQTYVLYEGKSYRLLPLTLPSAEQLGGLALLLGFGGGVAMLFIGLTGSVVASLERGAAQRAETPRGSKVIVPMGLNALSRFFERCSLILLAIGFLGCHLYFWSIQSPTTQQGWLNFTHFWASAVGAEVFNLVGGIVLLGLLFWPFFSALAPPARQKGRKPTAKSIGEAFYPWVEFGTVAGVVFATVTLF